MSVSAICNIFNKVPSNPDQICWKCNRIGRDLNVRIKQPHQRSNACASRADQLDLDYRPWLMNTYFRMNGMASPAQVKIE